MLITMSKNNGMIQLKHLFSFVIMTTLLIGCTQGQFQNFNDNATEFGSNVAIRISELLTNLRKTDQSSIPAPAITPISFQSLNQWNADLHSAALRAFLLSCKKIRAMDPQASMPSTNIGGKAQDWQTLCQKASQIDDGDDFAANAFFESSFTPYRLSKMRDEALFTGYYEISLRGSKKKHGPYQYPIYAIPPNLTTITPGQHGLGQNETPASGVLINGELRPYYSRAEINAGILKNKKLEIAWVDDPIRLFFLHIQGVGTIFLDDGDKMRIGFAAKNGHPYTAIGKVLEERGEIKREDISAPNIMQWLYNHPNQSLEVMNQNQSYIFFRKTTTTGPIGGQGVAVTPERSVAIDPKYIPYGTPVWIETAIPLKNKMQPYNRLMVAQDTGSAIRGPNRVDIFFGSGQEAEFVAGNLKSRGNLIILLPKTIKPEI